MLCIQIVMTMQVVLFLIRKERKWNNVLVELELISVKSRSIFSLSARENP